MTFKTFEALPSVSGVAANSVFTVNVPVGFTYHDFVFTLGGTTFNLTHITDLKLWVNGKVIKQIKTATELDNINKFDRMTAYAANTLRWTMERFGLDRIEARERTALGTGIPESVRRTLLDPKNALYDPVEVTSVQITGQIGAATAPTLTVKARRSAPRPTNVLGKVRNFTRNPSGAGDFEIADLPLNELISRVIFKDVSGAGDITKVTLKVNNNVVWERTVAENDRIQTDGVRTPQASYFVVDFSEDGESNNVPVVSQKDDVRWIVTTTGAMVIDIQYDSLGYLNT